MKRIILIFLSIVATFTYAQDVIIYRNGQTTNAEVLEVGKKDIKFKRADNPTGPIYTESKSKIRQVDYANGTSDQMYKPNIVFSYLKRLVSLQEKGIGCDIQGRYIYSEYGNVFELLSE